MKILNKVVSPLTIALLACIMMTGCGTATVQDYSDTETTGAYNSSSEYAENSSSALDISSVSVEDISSVSDDSSSISDNSSSAEFSLSDVPEYESSPYYVVNNNVPYFTDTEIENAKTAIQNNSTYFDDDNEQYLPLDDLGRCQTATALLSESTMPAEGETRGTIGLIKPSGWHTVKYPDVISDLYLYNRCHLIGWQLGNENDNELNLITGTRYLNVDGMLPFENQVAEYIRSTNNHVLYRITPVFVDDELVCRGVLMEAQSIEDDNCVFSVYCYDVQPSIYIDYATGKSHQIDDDVSSDTSETEDSSETATTSSDESTYILNTNAMKIHRSDCSAASRMSDYNRQEYTGDIADLIAEGYTTCGLCKPE
jgi:DNA-entry nuclease